MENNLSLTNIDVAPSCGRTALSAAHLGAAGPAAAGLALAHHLIDQTATPRTPTTLDAP